MIQQISFFNVNSFSPHQETYGGFVPLSDAKLWVFYNNIQIFCELFFIKANVLRIYLVFLEPIQLPQIFYRHLPRIYST